MPTTTPLTDEQIDALFNFVKSKYVDFYDVQVELVDHLASEVEQRMAASPDVPFDAALQQVFREFGIFGFLEVVEQKGVAVARRNRIVWWNSFQSLFRLPMLVGSLIVALTMYILFDQLKAESFLMVNGALALATGIGVLLYFRKIQPKKTHKLSSFQYQNIMYLGAVFNIYQMYYVCNILIFQNSSAAWFWLIPALCWLFWINFWACVLTFNTMLEEQRKQFPVAFA